jgi:phosphatidylglycerol:prolipoprotein diacylglycerol transferase
MFVLPFPEIDPWLFRLEVGGFVLALRWYALAYIAALLIGWGLAVQALRRPGLWPEGRAPMAPRAAEDLLTWTVLGVIGGGRLGYVLFYRPGHFLANPLEILMVWEGGMSFHGGLLGVIAAWGGFCLSRGLPFLSVADLMCLVTPPGLLLGRLANFVNAELWGRPSDLPWAVVFPGERAQACGQPAGEACARHPSQLYEAGLEGLVLGLALWWIAARGGLRRPGLVAGAFFAGYGLARFAVEFVREPDAQFVSPENPLGWAFSLGPVGVTMGQALSLPMILVGLLLVAQARRQARRRRPARPA